VNARLVHSVIEMSSTNVELARRGWDAIARGDLESIRPLLHPDVKWHGGDPAAPGACRDRGEALAFMQHARERRAQEGLGLGELVDVIDAGDRVVLVIRPPDSGDDDELRANLTTFRDGKVIEMVAFESPEAALAAARD
jgi:ketosteroid isomerase-like protein